MQLYEVVRLGVLVSHVDGESVETGNSASAAGRTEGRLNQSTQCDDEGMLRGT